MTQLFVIFNTIVFGLFFLYLFISAKINSSNLKISRFVLRNNVYMHVIYASDSTNTELNYSLHVMCVGILKLRKTNG